MEGEYILLPFPTYNTPRGLRQDPGCTAESLVEGQDLRKWGSRNACAVVDVRGTRGRRAAGGAGVGATGIPGAVAGVLRARPAGAGAGGPGGPREVGRASVR